MLRWIHTNAINGVCACVCIWLCHNNGARCATHAFIAFCVHLPRIFALLPLYAHTLRGHTNTHTHSTLPTQRAWCGASINDCPAGLAFGPTSKRAYALAIDANAGVSLCALQKLAERQGGMWGVVLTLLCSFRHVHVCVRVWVTPHCMHYTHRSTLHTAAELVAERTLCYVVLMLM